MLFERDSLSKRTEYSVKIQVKDKTRNQVYDTVTARVRQEQWGCHHISEKPENTMSEANLITINTTQKDRSCSTEECSLLCICFTSQNEQGRALHFLHVGNICKVFVFIRIVPASSQEIGIERLYFLFLLLSMESWRVCFKGNSHF